MEIEKRIEGLEKNMNNLKSKILCGTLSRVMLKRNFYNFKIIIQKENANKKSDIMQLNKYEEILCHLNQKLIQLCPQ